MKGILSRTAACAALVFMLVGQPSVGSAAGASGGGSDQEIARSVSAALAAHGYALDVSVNEGMVKLGGALPTQEDIPVAAFQARQIPGVRGVNIFSLGYGYYMGGAGGE